MNGLSTMACCQRLKAEQWSRYIYYHDFWAVLGLQMALEAAKALNEDQDVPWMTKE